jgi:hypothetical protein
MYLNNKLCVSWRNEPHNVLMTSAYIENIDTYNKTNIVAYKRRRSKHGTVYFSAVS